MYSTRKRHVCTAVRVRVRVYYQYTPKRTPGRAHERNAKALQTSHFTSFISNRTRLELPIKHELHSNGIANQARITFDWNYLYKAVR